MDPTRAPRRPNGAYTEPAFPHPHQPGTAYVEQARAPRRAAYTEPTRAPKPLHTAYHDPAFSPPPSAAPHFEQAEQAFALEAPTVVYMEPTRPPQPNHGLTDPVAPNLDSATSVEAARQTYEELAYAESKFEPLGWLGEGHGEGVRFVLEKLELGSREYHSFSSVEQSVTTLTTDYVEPTGARYRDIKFRKNPNIDATARKLVERGAASERCVDTLLEMVWELQTSGSKDVFMVLTDVRRFENAAASRLDGKDFRMFQAVTSIAKSCLRLRARVERGEVGGLLPEEKVLGTWLEGRFGGIDWGQMTAMSCMGFFESGSHGAILYSVLDIIEQITR